jgi:peptidoglycan/LPS O-acetylase OafA/YrhL
LDEHFYLTWPGLLLLLGPQRARTAAPAAACAVAVWRMIESQLASPTLPMVPSHFRTDLRLDALLWGCAFAFLLDNVKQREKLSGQLRLPVWVLITGTLILAAKFFSPLTSVWIACGVPIMLMGTITHPEWKLSRALELAPVAWLGRISYSLYLWQQLFLSPGWEHPAHAWTRWPLNLAACLTVSIASYYAIEKPLIRIGRRLARRISQPSAPSAHCLPSLTTEGAGD